MVNYKKHKLKVYVITNQDTRTYEDFYKYLGIKPTRLGIVSRMYDDLTASFLTESLKNIFYQDAKGSGNKYQSVNALAYDWDISTNKYCSYNS